MAQPQESHAVEGKFCALTGAEKERGRGQARVGRICQKLIHVGSSVVFCQTWGVRTQRERLSPTMALCQGSGLRWGSHSWQGEARFQGR